MQAKVSIVSKWPWFGDDAVTLNWTFRHLYTLHLSGGLRGAAPTTRRRWEGKYEILLHTKPYRSINLPLAELSAADDNVVNHPCSFGELNFNCSNKSFKYIWMWHFSVRRILAGRLRGIMADDGMVSAGRWWCPAYERKGLNANVLKWQKITFNYANDGSAIMNWFSGKLCQPQRWWMGEDFRRCGRPFPRITSGWADTTKTLSLISISSPNTNHSINSDAYILV